MAAKSQSQLPIDIYVRVSRIGKRENLISPEEQVRRAREHLRQLGLPEGEVLPHDLDESGGKLDRPGLQRGLDRVRKRQSGGMVVAWLDRLSRDSEHALGLVRQMEEAGARIYAPDAPSDWTTPEGELHGGIIFLFAQYVRRKARAGFEAAKQQAIARGIPINNRAPVGYDKTGPEAGRRLRPSKDAPHVLEAYKMRARGAGPTAIARYLEANGVRTSQGSTTWSKQAVMELLRNRVYLGELSYGTDRRFVNESAHEAIVPKDVWYAAQKPKRPRVEKVEGRGPAYLLTGLLRCFGCGYSMQGTTTSRGKRIYRCTRRHAGGICPAPAWVFVDDADLAAESLFWELSDDVVAHGSEEVEPADIPALEAEVELAERLLAQWLTPEMQAAMASSAAAYAEGTVERQERLAAAHAALGHARSELGGGRDLGGRTLREFWAQADRATRRDLLAEQFDCFALSRDGEFRAYLRGTAPEGLPRRGFRRDPNLVPFPNVPDGARQLLPESLLEPTRDGVA